MWTNYKVTWVFLTQLCASVPANPDIVQKWIDAQKPKARPAGGRSIDEIQEEVFRTIATEDEGEIQKSLLVFQRENGALVMRAGTVKAHIKDCARVLSNQYIGRLEGERAFSTRVLNGVYHDETQYWIPILDIDGRPMTEPTGRRDKPVHVNGRSALKTFEFVVGARMDFTLKVLGKAGSEHAKGKPKPSVSKMDLETLFTYGGVHGYGGERSDGEGRYHFTITEAD